MKKILVVILIIFVLIIICSLICIGVSSLGVISLIGAIPTPEPTLALTAGNEYWIEAIIPRNSLFSGLVVTNATIYNKPGNILSDPSITIIAFIPDATKVTLLRQQGNWCYVSGKYSPLREYGINTIETFEGWMDCSQLINYEPTPYPTPNRTPQPPE